MWSGSSAASGSATKLPSNIHCTQQSGVSNCGLPVPSGVVLHLRRLEKNNLKITAVVSFRDASAFVVWQYRTVVHWQGKLTVSLSRLLVVMAQL